MRLSFLLCLLLFLPSSSDKAHTDHEAAKVRLRGRLLSHYPKDGALMVPSGNMTVRVELRILNVFGLDEKEVMELNGWARLSWIDPELRWEPRAWPNIAYLFLPAGAVWTPDIGVTNAKQREAKDFTNVDRLQLQVHPDGHVVLYSYFISETPCPTDTFLLPFDHQACPVQIGTLYSTERDFNISVERIRVSKKEGSVGQWTPHGSQRRVSRSGQETKAERYQFVTVTIFLSRKALYHIVLVIIPYCLISSIAAVVFILKNPGERLALSLTILLSMTVYVMIVSQGAPKSMQELSLLGTFLLAQMTLLILLTCCVVVGPVATSKKRRSSSDLSNGGRDRSYWSFQADLACLGIYIICSVANAGLCLFIIPYFNPPPSDPADSFREKS